MSSLKPSDKSLHDLMNQVNDKLTLLLDAIEEMEQRDRCRYWCRDKGNHHMQCIYNNKG